MGPAASMKPYDAQQVINEHSNSRTIILGCTFLQNDLSAEFLHAKLRFLLMAKKKNIYNTSNSASENNSRVIYLKITIKILIVEIYTAYIALFYLLHNHNPVKG